MPTRYADRFDLQDEGILLEIDLYSGFIYESLEGLQVISRFAPFFLDMNRSRDGIENPRTPDHLKNPPHEYYTTEGELILRRRYTAEEEAHVLGYYDLYHGLLSALIERMRRERGYALMIDGHSMTAVGQGHVHDQGEERDNFVIGTLGDTSAHKEIISAFEDALREEAELHALGLTVSKDVPYSGGFITRRHNDPENHVHVIQVEISMETYMYEALDEDVVKRYALKPARVRIVQGILRRAIGAASDAAQKIHA